MKKKGLIISTVVMVVVLIASLTTATYAWFSSTAMAKISQLNVKTAASQGLTIAAMGTDATSGTMTLNSDVWIGANTGYGDTLEFTGAFGGTTVYGCSGDGTYLVTAANEAGKINESGAVLSGKPVKVVNAEKNVQYFELDLAIQTTEDLEVDKDLVLKTFTVTADGAMAAASRIAFYTSAADGGEEQGKTSTFGLAADKLVNVLMAEPFANSKYSNKNWASNGTVTTPLAYKQAEATATKFVSANVTKDITDASNYVYVKGTSYFQGSADTNVETFNVADKVLGTFAQNSPLDTVYLRLVIWFEGEDAECVAAWAGTGITVNMEFGYKVTTTP